MTREDIIRMAREAGSIDSEEVIETVFVAFAAAERENIAAWVEDMCAGLDARTIANGIRNGGNDDMRAFEVRK